MDKLLECPFCKKQVHEVYQTYEDEYYKNNRYQIKCDNCGICYLMANNKEEAGRLWNKRMYSFHVCSLNHCRRCGECIAPPRTLCDVCRQVKEDD